jgi:hypothetical protein
MQRKFVTFSFAIVALAVACVPAFAHHGGAAYDSKTTLTLKGTITEFRYINPHAQIYFDVKDDQGNVVHWNCETIDPAMLSRQGWARDVIKPGDVVTIVGRPAKSGAKVMVLQKMILANGKEMDAKYLY